jgi:hypothetical protein
VARIAEGILKSLDTDPLPVREKFDDHELDIVRKLHAAKMSFLAGTDTPAGVDVIPGINLHLELQRSRKIAGVIADGHYLSQRDLDQLRARIKQIAATK